MKIVKDTLVTLLTQIITTILAMIGIIIIARVLGPNGKGIYTLVILVPTLLVSLGNLGIGVANAYFVGKRKYLFKDIISNSFIVGLGLGIILAIAFIIYFLLCKPSFLKNIKPEWIFITTFTLPFYLLMIYFQHILLGENKINGYNLVSPIRSSILLIFLCILLFVFRMRMLGPILAWTTGVIMAAILGIFLVCRLKLDWSFNWLLFKDSIKYGIQGYVGNLISLLNYRLDMILVSLFMGIKYVGYYSVAVNLAEVLWYFPGAVGTVLFSRTPRLAIKEVNKSTPIICRNTIFLTVLSAIFLLILGKSIISIFFGSLFLPALKPLYILLPGVVAISVNKVLCNELIGRGKPIIGTIAAIVSLGINVPLNLIFIPIWGISGAAFASTISYLVCAIVPLVAFLKISYNRLLDTLIMKKEDLKIYTNILFKIRSCNILLRQGQTWKIF